MTLEKLKKLTDEQLNERFPFMVCHAISGEIPKDENGKILNHFSDWGWRDIQLVLAEHIKPIYDKFDDNAKKDFWLFDIKEKWGRLDTFWTVSNEAIDNWTTLAEYISSYTCIKCGKIEQQIDKHYWYYESKGWICPYCENCAKKLYEDRMKDFGHELVSQNEWKDDYTYTGKEPTCTFERWGEGPKLTITMSIDDFWKLDDD